MPLILGLTGSLGSGKTFVSSLMSRCGAKVVCADTIARDIVQPGKPVLSAIARQFGDGVLLPDGSLDRHALAKIVFADPDKRLLLESLIHPTVRERELELIQSYRADPLVVLDVPLLFETGLDAECDQTVVVTINDEERFRRLASYRGIDRDEAQRRLSAQMSQADKIARADHVIDNSGSRRATAAKVAVLLAHLFPGGFPAGISTGADLGPES